ncbi:MAG: hypothetical protein ACOX4O_04810 [Eubacteriales bacterium]
MSRFNFREWLAAAAARVRRFFSGRYGFDPLGGFLLFAHVTIILVASPFSYRNPFVYRIIAACALIPLVFAVFRLLSRNFAARRRENAVFLDAVYAVRRFFLRAGSRIKNGAELTKNRIKYIRTNRYRRCPDCRAVLCFPVKKGHRGKKTAVCPRCGKRFSVFIWI